MVEAWRWRAYCHSENQKAVSVFAIIDEVFCRFSNMDTQIRLLVDHCLVGGRLGAARAVHVRWALASRCCEFPPKALRGRGAPQALHPPARRQGRRVQPRFLALPAEGSCHIRKAKRVEQRHCDLNSKPAVLEPCAKWRSGQNTTRGRRRWVGPDVVHCSITGHRQVSCGVSWRVL